MILRGRTALNQPIETLLFSYRRRIAGEIRNALTLLSPDVVFQWSKIAPPKEYPSAMSGFSLWITRSKYRVKSERVHGCSGSFSPQNPGRLKRITSKCAESVSAKRERFLHASVHPDCV